MEKFTVIAGKPRITKDPQAVLDYGVDWGPWLKPLGDSIVSHQVFPAGVVLDSSAVVDGEDEDQQPVPDGMVAMWISGGTAGSVASAVVQITTAAGRTDERTVYFVIKNR